MHVRGKKPVKNVAKYFRGFPLVFLEREPTH